MSGIDVFILMYVLWVFNVFFIHFLSINTPVKNFNFKKGQRYARINLRKIKDDDIFIIGKDYGYVSSDKTNLLHEKLELAIKIAKTQGKHIVRVGMDDCLLKVIKNANPAK